MTDKPYEITTDVPVPKEQRVELSKMKVGESILFPMKKRGSVQSRASALKRTTDKSFTIRMVDKDNCRVWRLS